MQAPNHWRASILIGLGSFGITCVVPTLHQTRASNKVWGLGIGLESNPAIDTDKLSYCKLDADIHDFCTQNPQPWFDTRLLRQPFVPTDRRWIRFSFLHEILTTNSVVAFLQKRLAELNTSTTIYLVTNLNEPESAALLDLAYLIQSIAHIDHYKIRLRAYVVLDAVQSHKTYAALREIIRVETSETPIALHETIPHRYSLKQHETWRLFDGFYVYQTPLPKSAANNQLPLQRIISDVLRLTVDPLFGAVIASVDDNIEESITHERGKLDVNEAFFVGVRHATTAHIPVMSLNSHFAPRAARGLLQTWLGLEHGSEPTLLLAWATNKLRSGDIQNTIGTTGIQLINGTIVAWGENTLDNALEELTTVDVQILMNLYNMDNDGFGPEDSPTAWTPKVAILSSLRRSNTAGSIDRVRFTVFQLLQDYLGELDYLDLSDEFATQQAQRSGQLFLWMQSCNEKNVQLFKSNLNSFIEYGLQAAGLLPIVKALHDLEIVLEITLNLLQQALQSRSTIARSRIPRPRQAIQRSGEAIKALNKPFYLLGSEPHHTLMDFLSLADEIRDTLAVECAFLAYQELVQACRVYVQEATNRFRDWEMTLYQHPESLWHVVNTIVQASDIHQNTEAGWLVSDSWLLEQETIITKRLHAQVHLWWNKEWNPAVGTQSLSTTAHSYWSSNNWRILSESVQKVIKPYQQEWTAWNYLFGPRAIHNSAQAIVNSLTHDHLHMELNVQPPQEWHYYFVHPPTDDLREVHAKQVEQYALTLQNVSNTYEGITGFFSAELSALSTDIGFFVAADVVPIANLSQFTNWQSSYLQEIQPSQLHIFAAEAQAAYYERHLNLRRQLHNATVAALEHYMYLPLFIWAVATTTIQSWINAEVSLYLPAFVELAAKLRFYHLSEASVQESIEADVRHQIELWEQNPDYAPKSDVWQWAISLSLPHQADGIYQAMAHDIMDACIARMEEARRTTQNQADNDFILILLDIARTEREQCKKAVRKFKI